MSLEVHGLVNRIRKLEEDHAEFRSRIEVELVSCVDRHEVVCRQVKEEKEAREGDVTSIQSSLSSLKGDVTSIYGLLPQAANAKSVALQAMQLSETTDAESVGMQLIETAAPGATVQAHPVRLPMRLSAAATYAPPPIQTHYAAPMPETSNNVEGGLEERQVSSPLGFPSPLEVTPRLHPDYTTKEEVGKAISEVQHAMTRELEDMGNKLQAWHIEVRQIMQDAMTDEFEAMGNKLQTWQSTLDSFAADARRLYTGIATLESMMQSQIDGIRKEAASFHEEFREFQGLNFKEPLELLHQARDLLVEAQNAESISKHLEVLRAEWQEDMYTCQATRSNIMAAVQDELEAFRRDILWNDISEMITSRLGHSNDVRQSREDLLPSRHGGASSLDTINEQVDGSMIRDHVPPSLLTEVEDLQNKNNTFEIAEPSLENSGISKSLAAGDATSNAAFVERNQGSNEGSHPVACSGLLTEGPGLLTAALLSSSNDARLTKSLTSSPYSFVEHKKILQNCAAQEPTMLDDVSVVVGTNSGLEATPGTAPPCLAETSPRGDGFEHTPTTKPLTAAPPNTPRSAKNLGHSMSLDSLLANPELSNPTRSNVSPASSVCCPPFIPPSAIQGAGGQHCPVSLTAKVATNQASADAISLQRQSNPATVMQVQGATSPVMPVRMSSSPSRYAAPEPGAVSSIFLGTHRTRAALASPRTNALSGVQGARVPGVAMPTPMHHTPRITPRSAGTTTPGTPSTFASPRLQSRGSPPHSTTFASPRLQSRGSPPHSRPFHG